MSGEVGSARVVPKGSISKLLRLVDKPVVTYDLKSFYHQLAKVPELAEMSFSKNSVHFKNHLILIRRNF